MENRSESREERDRISVDRMKWEVVHCFARGRETAVLSDIKKQLYAIFSRYGA